MSTRNYTTVQANSLENLTRAVNKRIEEGWEPLGGICTWTNAYGNTTFTQALIMCDTLTPFPMTITAEEAV